MVEVCHRERVRSRRARDADDELVRVQVRRGHDLPAVQRVELLDLGGVGVGRELDENLVAEEEGRRGPLEAHHDSGVRDEVGPCPADLPGQRHRPVATQRPEGPEDDDASRGAPLYAEAHRVKDRLELHAR